MSAPNNIHRNHARVRRAVTRLLARPWWSALLVLSITVWLGYFAAKVRLGFTVENYFPGDSDIKHDYDRFKADFPQEDALALVIVDADDLWTVAGMHRVAALEADLVRIDGVLDTEGLSTVRTLVSRGDGELAMQPLLPEDGITEAQVAAVRHTVETDPMFAWKLAPPPPPLGPDFSARTPVAGVTTIGVILTPAHNRDEITRTSFLLAVREVVARHQRLAAQAGTRQRVELSGVPIIRSQYNELITEDISTLFPLAFLVIFALLYAAFRSLRVLLAALVVILVSIIWTYGVMGMLGYSIEILTTITPMVVMIISLSDTLHIVAHYRDALGEGAQVHEAVIEATSETAVPCFLSELTIGLGFLTLLSVGVVALSQFGVATAAGMMLTWLANMLVLPLMLNALAPRIAPRPGRQRLAGGLGRFVAWIEGVVNRRARLVVASALMIVAVAAFFGVRTGRHYRVFGDLRPDDPLMQTMARAEQLYGGVVPLMVHIEPKPSVPGKAPAAQEMMDPQAIALMDRIAATIKQRIPSARSVGSAAELWRQAYRLFAPERAAQHGGLPPTRATAAQLFIIFDDPKLTRHYLRRDLGSAAVVAMMPNVESTEAKRILADLDAYLAAEEAATGYRVRATGLFSNLADINRVLVDGLASSLLWALLVTFVVFCTVLRSWRLALIAMVPNVLPLAITFGFMGLVGIDITPSTVIVCAITITIADDDTIQYFARFRAAFAHAVRRGSREPHREAANATMRAVGLPMILTASVVTIGFLSLVFSNFQGLSQLGLITGISLFAAMFADLFLSPLLLMTLRPRMGTGGGQGEATGASDGMQ